MLLETIKSLEDGYVWPLDHFVGTDHDRQGPAAIRNELLARVETPYVAFLDDDDLAHRGHLLHLYAEITRTNADLVYPWFMVDGGHDPLGWFGKEFDPDALRQNNYVPVTVICQTESLRRAGGFKVREGEGAPCEDWGAWLAMLDQGARFVHLPMVTWTWRHHGRNTGGRPDSW
jgi:glycosyltransferase involved in cell wall biosynthesis